MFQLNLDELLVPIPGPNPSGENLHYTEVYDQIKEAKRSDDLLEKGEWQTDIKRSDWRLVIQLCGHALTNRSKDLQIAVWLAEALLHEHGFGGLAAGLQLLSQLTADFWETLYPQIEDGDLGYRDGPFAYLDIKLADALYQVPICDPGTTKGFSYYAWEESRIVGADSGLDEAQKEQRQSMIDEGKISAEEFRAAVNLSPIGFYQELHTQLTGCREQLLALDKVTRTYFKTDPPGFTRLAESVDACLRVVEKINTEKQKSEVAELDEYGPCEGVVENVIGDFPVVDDNEPDNGHGGIFSKHDAITDISQAEHALWKSVANQAGNGHLKHALDQLMAAAALAPSVRQKNRYRLLVAKLCLRAGRHDLAQPIAEDLYQLIETFKLEKWEHPAWIADVIETLYRCLEHGGKGDADRTTKLFQKLCTLNITKAATFRLRDVS